MSSSNSTMSASLEEMLVPPLLCLAFFVGGVVIWVLVNQYTLRKRNSPEKRRGIINIRSDTSLSLSNNNKNNKIIPIANGKDTTFFSSPTDPLFQDDDIPLIQHMRGEGWVNFKELFIILLPTILSLGVCPITILLHEPLKEGLWPSSHYDSAPNINDAIACFLVPAGMVYAISFGFAFQQVAGSFQEVQVHVLQHTEQLERILKLSRHLTCIPALTRLTVVRAVKELTLNSATTFFGQDAGDETKMSIIRGKGIDDLLRLLYSGSVQNVVGKADVDLYQKSVYDRLERILSEDTVLSGKISLSRMHFVQWVFLEVLGYFTFLGILLVQNSSYRADLSMCVVTVVSISLLCYIVADLDSPFHGVLQVNLDGYRQLLRDLEHDFDRVTLDVKEPTSLRLSKA